MATLFGLETEYAIAGRQTTGVRHPPQVLAQWVEEELKRTVPHLHAGDGAGFFVANGSKYYVDCGGHPEWATCEVTTPEEAVCYLYAGERIVHGAVQRLLESGAASAISLFRTNVDYVARTSWGAHESYLHRVSDDERLAEELIPHFVSRIVFCGAGGFDPFAPGIAFTLSPRAHFMVTSASTSSTSQRGIFHIKDETLSRTHRRMHVLCGESLGSHVATYLKVGTTALVLALVELRRSPGRSVALESPLAALRAIAGDPTCTERVALSTGHRVSALDVQRVYLEAAEAALPTGKLPPFAAEVIALWRRVLELLSEGPDAVSRVLDWGVKYAQYERQMRELPSEEVARWNDALKAICRRREVEGRESESEVYSAHGLLSQVLEGRRPWPDLLSERGLTLDGLKRFCVLRSTLFELDTRFGEVGPTGLWARLEATGLLAHRMVDDEEIERARSEPPRAGRARLRGAWIQRLHAKMLEGSPREGRDWRRPAAAWSWVWDPERRRLLDLSRPLDEEERWLSPLEAKRRGAIGLPAYVQFAWDQLIEESEAAANQAQDPRRPPAPARNEGEAHELMRLCAERYGDPRARSLMERITQWLRGRSP